MTSDIAFADKAVDSADIYIQHTETYLGNLVRDILNPEIPIKKTHDLEVCQYCIYRGICAR